MALDRDFTTNGVYQKTSPRRLAQYSSRAMRCSSPTNSTFPKAPARATASTVPMATKLRRRAGPAASRTEARAEGDHRSARDHPQSRIWRCLVHSSGSRAFCLSTSAVTVAGCDPSHMALDDLGREQRQLDQAFYVTVINAFSLSDLF